MSDWVYIQDIRNFEGQEIEVQGWLFNKRSSGKIHFLVLRDGTGLLQAVMDKETVGESLFNLYDTLTQESSLRVRGRVRKDPRAPGGFELLVQNLELFQRADGYPITKKEHGVGFLLPKRHLWLRSRRQWALLRIRNEVEKAICDFLEDRGFLRVDAPILTPSACEGTSTLFQTDYFGEPAYLSQSGQLYMEAACMAYGKVYCFGPTFRAEKSKTRRHLTEFWMIEPEWAFAHLEDVMALAEALILALLERVLERRREELEILERDITSLESIRAPFPQISYREAVELLKKKGLDFTFGGDFGGDEETALSKSFSSPLIIHRYPGEIKAFYMKRDPKDPDVALCMDMMAPEGYGEIIGGSAREDSLDALLARFREWNLPEKDYEWYLDLRRYGTVPHAGFGLGLERTLSWIAGVPHVRETIPFPRLLEKIYP